MSKLAIRIRDENSDHHLWNNNGTWFMHYTVHNPDFTKARIRCSLHTKSLPDARRLRDDLIATLAGSRQAPRELAA